MHTAVRSQTYLDIHNAAAHLDLRAHGHCNFTSLKLRLGAFAGAGARAQRSARLSLLKPRDGLTPPPPLVRFDGVVVAHARHLATSIHSIQMALNVLHMHQQHNSSRVVDAVTLGLNCCPDGNLQHAESNWRACEMQLALMLHDATLVYHFV